MNDWNESAALKDKRNKKLKLPPSRGVLVLLPLNLKQPTGLGSAKTSRSRQRMCTS